MIKIAVTGPESSGKTTLCLKLRDHFNAAYNPEYAREYLNTTEGYSIDDLLIIAKEQIKREDEFPLDEKILICDTEPINFKIWSLYKFNILQPELEKIVNDTVYDLYFLCYPDIPWEEDPLRENPSSEERMQLFNWFEKEINLKGTNYQIIRGSSKERVDIAKRAIGNIMHQQ